MADKTEKWEDNVAGKFYVDKECILCSVCSDAAPLNFKMSDDTFRKVSASSPRKNGAATKPRAMKNFI